MERCRPIVAPSSPGAWEFEWVKPWTFAVCKSSTHGGFMEAMQMTHCLWAFKTAIILYLFPFFRQHDLSRGVGPELSEKEGYTCIPPLRIQWGWFFPSNRLRSCAMLKVFSGPLFSMLIAVVELSGSACEVYEVSNLLWACVQYQKLGHAICGFMDFLLVNSPW